MFSDHWRAQTVKDTSISDPWVPARTSILEREKVEGNESGIGKWHESVATCKLTLRFPYLCCFEQPFIAGPFRDEWKRAVGLPLGEDQSSRSNARTQWNKIEKKTKSKFSNAWNEFLSSRQWPRFGPMVGPFTVWDENYKMQIR